MSRHTLPPLLNDGPHPLAVAIGWDPPLATFFAVVSRPGGDDDEDDIILWVGTDYAELPEVRAAIEAVRPYAAIPDDLVSLLESDRLNEGARPRPVWLT